MKQIRDKLKQKISLELCNNKEKQEFLMEVKKLRKKIDKIDNNQILQDLNDYYLKIYLNFNSEINIFNIKVNHSMAFLKAFSTFIFPFITFLYTKEFLDVSNIICDLLFLAIIIYSLLTIHIFKIYGYNKGYEDIDEYYFIEDAFKVFQKEYGFFESLCSRTSEIKYTEFLKNKICSLAYSHKINSYCLQNLKDKFTKFHNAWLITVLLVTVFGSIIFINNPDSNTYKNHKSNLKENNKMTDHKKQAKPIIKNVPDSRGKEAPKHNSLGANESFNPGTKPVIKSVDANDIKKK